ncbi:MAG: tyrosine-type recombinase/integrase [Candidatus Baldrarchaeia archaeon]
MKIHCHTFRHFFATEVYAKTGDLMLVKELLGHEDIRETQIYVHIVRMSNPKKEAIKVDINDPEKMLELIRQGWKAAVQTDKFIIFEKSTFP